MNYVESDEILTVEEVAALLKIHPKTVYKFLKANELQGHRFGRIWRFKKSDIMKLLENRTLRHSKKERERFRLHSRSFASFYPEYLGLLVRPDIERNPMRQPVGRGCREVTRC